jgi:hypothetical protein
LTYTPRGMLNSLHQLNLRRETMCSRVICNTCKKYTWSGCGGHIEEALAGVPQDQICKCG